MRSFTALALGLLGATVAAASDVEVLTKDSFPDFVKDNDLVLAECKLPLCPGASSPFILKLILNSLRSMFISMTSLIY
jgi:hypothetical protein